MTVITPRSEEASVVRQFNIDMTPESFSSQWDEGFVGILGHRLLDLGEKPSPVSGDVMTYATGLPHPDDTLKITIV